MRIKYVLIYFLFSVLNSFAKVYLDRNNIENHIKNILKKYPVTDSMNYKQWLLKAVSLIDLTTLSGDDTRSNVTRLCQKVNIVIIN